MISKGWKNLKIHHQELGLSMLADLPLEWPEALSLGELGRLSINWENGQARDGVRGTEPGLQSLQFIIECARKKRSAVTPAFWKAESSNPA